jgi:hypothetical protein
MAVVCSLQTVAGMSLKVAVASSHPWSDLAKAELVKEWKLEDGGTRVWSCVSVIKRFYLCHLCSWQTSLSVLGKPS